MSYRPDYERILNEVVQEVLPKTPEGWGLIALAAIGIWFIWMVIAVVLEAAKDHCTRTQDEASQPDLETAIEQ